MKIVNQTFDFHGKRMLFINQLIEKQQIIFLPVKKELPQKKHKILRDFVPCWPN